MCETRAIRAEQWSACLLETFVACVAKSATLKLLPVLSSRSATLADGVETFAVGWPAAVLKRAASDIAPAPLIQSELCLDITDLCQPCMTLYEVLTGLLHSNQSITRTINFVPLNSPSILGIMWAGHNFLFG